MIAAVDPGTFTGLCLWGADGYRWSAQGSMHEMVSLLVKACRAEPVDELVIEDVFVGPSPRGSLALEHQAGFACGALWSCGLLLPVVRLEASVWRKVLRYPKLPRTQRSKALKAHALGLAKDLAGRPFDDKHDHEAEAVCMARARWIQRFEEPSKLC